MATVSRDLPYDSRVPLFSGVRTDSMSLTVAQARESFETESDLAELVREFEAVQRHYQEVIEAMALGANEVAPVANSAEVTLSFRSAVRLLV
jgi:hypothetical protein